jgi:prenylcysteine alpha-carboxyl methylesterase
VIGLSGVYSITDHFEVESARGVEWISAMHRVMGGHERFDTHSPSHTVAHVPEGGWRHDWPVFRLMHGQDDITVPAEASTKCELFFFFFFCPLRLCNINSSALYFLLYPTV